jgi:hypothetical protein
MPVADELVVEDDIRRVRMADQQLRLGQAEDQPGVLGRLNNYQPRNANLIRHHGGPPLH